MCIAQYKYSLLDLFGAKILWDKMFNFNEWLLRAQILSMVTMLGRMYVTLMHLETGVIKWEMLNFLYFILF